MPPSLRLVVEPQRIILLVLESMPRYFAQKVLLVHLFLSGPRVAPLPHVQSRAEVHLRPPTVVISEC
jgi:hypothetical protein